MTLAGLLLAITALPLFLSGCGKQVAEKPVESQPPQIEQQEPEPIEERKESDDPLAHADSFTTSMINAPVLSAILPWYEEISGMKIIVSGDVTDADTLTADSPLDMSREEMIAFYKTCFKQQGFEIRPVNETTVHFAQQAEPAAEAGKKGEAPRRIAVAPRRTVIGSPPDAASATKEEGENAEFTVMHVQSPLIDYIVPEYSELVGKKIDIDSSVTGEATMTIQSQKKMDRAEAIQFYKDSFRINGYTLTPGEDGGMILSKTKK